MANLKIGYIVGSLSSQSINRRLAQALIKLAPANLDFVEIRFNDLPLYSQDHDGDYPPVARAFKDQIAAVDGLLFVTPEFNRSIPGALKNALDWASRPHGQSAFQGQPTTVVGASPGAIGSAIGQRVLRSVLDYFGLPQMTTPEVYIQMKPGLIDDNGDVTVESTRNFLTTFMADYGAFAERIIASRTPKG